MRGFGERVRRHPKSFEAEIDQLKAPDGGTLIPWLLMATGPAIEVIKRQVPLPWLAGLGLGAFCALYVGAVRSAHSERLRTGPVPGRLLLALTAVTYALAIGYAGSWLLLFPLLSLAGGTVATSRRHLGVILIVFGGSAGILAGMHSEGFWNTASLAYGTFLSGLVVAIITTLFHAVAMLKATRQELARNAVAQERLRFSRDLHDLLGHTLSVVVVKSEAARRLAPRDLDAALSQVADIEAVGRQALTEIREAVTGYREGSLATELDRARSALSASDIEAVVGESGPPLPPQAAALLGWVVREGVTNVVRHSGASTCAIELRTDQGRARLTITDDGRGVGSGPVTGRIGTGLKGLAERLASAGGSLETGPGDRLGFRVVAELPVEEENIP